MSPGHPGRSVDESDERALVSEPYCLELAGGEGVRHLMRVVPALRLRTSSLAARVGRPPEIRQVEPGRRTLVACAAAWRWATCASGDCPPSAPPRRWRPPVPPAPAKSVSCRLTKPDHPRRALRRDRWSREAARPPALSSRDGDHRELSGTSSDNPAKVTVVVEPGPTASGAVAPTGAPADLRRHEVGGRAAPPVPSGHVDVRAIRSRHAGRLVGGVSRHGWLRSETALVVTEGCRRAAAGTEDGAEARQAAPRDRIGAVTDRVGCRSVDGLEAQNGWLPPGA